MNMVDFIKQFDSEEKCREYLYHFAKEEIVPGSTIRCDGYSAYDKLAENSYRVDAENYDP